MGKKKIDENVASELIFPLLALDNVVLTPMIPQPVKIDSEEQRNYIDKCFNNNAEIFVATNEKIEGKASGETIKTVGMVCVADRMLQMPGAPTLAFVRPLYRAKFERIVYSPSYPMAKVTPLKTISQPKKRSLETKFLLDRINELFRILMQYVPDLEKETALKLIEENSKSEVEHVYAMSHVSPISWEEKYRILECSSFNKLLHTVALIFDEAEQRIRIQAKVHERTHQEISRQQKENFLRMHLNQIREELGEHEENDEVSELIAKSAGKNWSEEADNHFKKEIRKLRRLNINNPEYSVQHAYLEAFLQLPWNNYNNSDISMDTVEDILNRDHYGLEKVKERILEYMAVMKLRNDLKAPILCLYGPPGVGKTSIGRSVAEAIGREYQRISLGGMHDEAEIRGHRRTYIGAMPGRFLHALSKCKNGDPLILLDEIDKVGKDYKGDPSSALLEALDPEQNNTFHDNFIDFPYDLSRVLFIATANDLSTIPAPLRDRMEIIEMPAYTQKEKLEIALRHLVGQALTDNGFDPKEISFSEEAIESIIKYHTKEKGVRQLKMQIAKIIRKLALQKVKGKKIPDEITGKHVSQFLDKKDSGYTGLGFHC